MSQLLALQPPTEIPNLQLAEQRIVIRELTSADHSHIEAVFDGLSEQDRYYRFFRPMPTYPASVMELLTGMDGDGHVAVGAFDRSGLGDDASDEICVGVARFVRSTRQPSSAEVAVTVSASHRGLGLAGSMVESLDDLADSRGIEELEAMVHPANRAAARLFRSMGFAMTLEDGTVVGRRPVGRAKLSTDQLSLAA